MATVGVSAIQNPLVSQQEVIRLLRGQSTKLKIFDCSWYMAGSNPIPAAAQFEIAHFNGAQYFDIDVVCDQKTTLPHMAPAPAEFERHMSNFGVSNDDRVICYDYTGNFVASGRAWWLFRLFGHDNVSIMHGEFDPRKIDDKTIVETGEARKYSATNFRARFRPELVVNTNQVLQNIRSKKFQLVDARPAGRFEGVIAEPRRNLLSGHVPGSTSLPWADFLVDKKLRGKSELQDMFKGANVDLSKPIVTACGSGVTACVANIALATLGVDAPMYDGSWTEYGQETVKNPIETGKAS